MSAQTAPTRSPWRRSAGAAAPERRPRPDLHVVPEPRHRHTLAYVLLSLVIGAGAVFGAVSLNALAAGHAVEARELEQRVADAERRYGQLVAEVARLEDPARIRQAATELGMIPAVSPRYLMLHRALPSDGAGDRPVLTGATTDPLKPVISAER